MVDAFQGSGSTFRDLTLLLESLVTPGTPIKTNPLSRAGNQASKNLASILAEFDEGGLFGFRVSPHNIEMPGRLRRLKASNKNAGRTFPKYRRVANESEKADAWAVAQALQDSTREEIARLEATRATAGKPPVPKPAWKR